VVAKGLRDFARANPLLVIKGGVLDGKFMSPDEVRQLADLESREVLLAKVAGGMQGILQQAISLVAAPLSQAARLLAALEQAAADNPSLLAAAEETAEATNEEPAAEAVTEEPAAEAVTDEPAAEAVTEEPAAEAASAAPAAPPTAETAAEDTTPAPAAEDN
jgi:large subunit ribosomal protein L10